MCQLRSFAKDSMVLYHAVIAEHDSALDHNAKADSGVLTDDCVISDPPTVVALNQSWPSNMAPSTKALLSPRIHLRLASAS